MRYKFALALPAAAALFVTAPFATRPALAQPTTITACQTISKPGSYVLSGNLSGYGDCLVITASFVTIDLQGFLITGQSAGTGISASEPVDWITVRNGFISGFVTAVQLGGVTRSSRDCKYNASMAAYSLMVSSRTIPCLGAAGLARQLMPEASSPGITPLAMFPELGSKQEAR
jgi:hypothetical protein